MDTAETRVYPSVDVVVLDVDGTLVDTVYEHVVAWARAFDRVGVPVPSSVLHRAIGMDGDSLVSHVAGESVERGCGDEVRSLHDEEFGRLTTRLRLLPGADRIIGALRQQGLAVVVASSGNQKDTERALDLVPDAHLVAAVITGSDVDAGKPATDLLDAARERTAGDRLLVVGDSVWDARAARDHGDSTVALLTGGITEADLRDAGAAWVFPTLAELVVALDRVLSTSSNVANETQHEALEVRA